MVETQRIVNNSIYDKLGERWYAAQDDPVALLRAEARLRNPWIAERLLQQYGQSAHILDIGCGGGLLTNDLSRRGFNVVGLDSSRESLCVAQAHDLSRSVRYLFGDASALPFESSTFDAVTALDVLEHVEDPGAVIQEAARVLRPSGTFFFHTFSRNWLAWLVVIKGVEWFVRNTPHDMHVLRLFITPAEIRALCNRASLDILEIHGSGPIVFSTAFWKMLLTRRVPVSLQFEFKKFRWLGYTGFARKHR